MGVSPGGERRDEGVLMDQTPPDDDREVSANETPEGLLDLLRDHPEWKRDVREAVFDRLIALFPPETLLQAARSRLVDLSGDDGEAILRILEAYGSDTDLEPLARSLAEQPDLTPERAWEALSVLEGSGLIEKYPELADRREEIEEVLGDEGSLEELAAQIEDDEDGVWVALQGLGVIEPDVRAEIVSGLGNQPMGPGLATLLRHLVFAQEPSIRTAALDALASHIEDHPALLDAWAAIAADHPEPTVMARARRWLGSDADSVIAEWKALRRPTPRLWRSLVTSLDGEGRGEIVLAAEWNGEFVSARFSCNVMHGIEEVSGVLTLDDSAVTEFLADFASRADRDLLEGHHELALGLLAGSLTLCGAGTPPVLSFWIEKTVGLGFRGCPFASPMPDFDPSSVCFEEMPERAKMVLDACPQWLDDSNLTYDLADELFLGDGLPPRESGAFRFLFERRLRERLELYRRGLLWMAAFWHSSDSVELARSALAIAWQLSDPQHAVPGHPFLDALAERSLSSAAEFLRRGIDLRTPEVRARHQER